MRRSLFLVVPAAVCLLISACGGEATPGAGTPGDRITVVAGNYPLAAFVEAVGGDFVEVTNLAAPGVEPHDVELSGRQVQDLTTADLIALIPDYQPSLDDAIEATGSQDRTLDVTDGLALAQGEGTEGEGDGPALDPHFWLDPSMAQQAVNRIATRLGEIDPGREEAFRANAEKYNANLDILNQEYEVGLRKCVRRDFVTSHTAFGYLAARYDLHQEPITGLSPEAEPSPQQLEDVVQFVKEHGVTVIFFEELVSPDVAETIAAETGARTMVLSPIENRTSEQEAAGKDLLAIARDNLANLREALGCT